MKLNSYTITQGRDRAPARAMLKAIGYTDEDLKKPIIGVANTWIETMPCNYNLRELATHVKAGIRAAGGKTIPGAGRALLRLNVPGVVMYGGTIMPGPNNSTVQAVFEAVGQHAA